MTNEELRALCDKATPGPWQATYTEFANAAPAWVVEHNGQSIVIFPPAAYNPLSMFNAAFIAACREAVPALLAEVERLKAELAQAIKERDAARIVANEFAWANNDSLPFNFGKGA